MNVMPFVFNTKTMRSSIRVVDKGGDPWFVAKDVANLLGYIKPRNAISAHCKGALKQGLPTSSGMQEMIIIPERDVYRLIMKSKLPEAEKFEEWVVGEVLPSIRKNGGYIAGQEKDSPELILAKAMKVADTLIKTKTIELKAAQAEIKRAQPKVEFHEAVTNAKDAISVGQAAKILNTGRTRLMRYLRRNDWVNSDNEPYQAKINSGYMDFKLGEYFHPEEGLKESITALITGKGLARLEKMLMTN